MQLHQLRPVHKTKHCKRVGRGGKRGTFSGRGSKGQKSRAGHRIRPGFRGGDNPLWKLFPKQRGAGKKTEIKHALSRLRRPRPSLVNLNDLNEHFQDGDRITSQLLVKNGIIKTAKRGVKILGSGELKRKLTLSGLEVSQSAGEKILKAGGSIN